MNTPTTHTNTPSATPPATDTNSAPVTPADATPAERVIRRRTRTGPKVQVHRFWVLKETASAIATSTTHGTRSTDARAPLPRAAFTTIYAHESVFQELLALADGNAIAVNEACRLASRRAVRKSGESWGTAVLAKAHRLLATARTLADKADAENAALNNAYWVA